MTSAEAKSERWYIQVLRKVLQFYERIIIGTDINPFWPLLIGITHPIAILFVWHLVRNLLDKDFSIAVQLAYTECLHGWPWAATAFIGFSFALIKVYQQHTERMEVINGQLKDLSSATQRQISELATNLLGRLNSHSERVDGDLKMHAAAIESLSTTIGNNWESHLLEDQKNWHSLTSEAQIVLTIDITGHFHGKHVDDLCARLFSASKPSIPKEFLGDGAGNQATPIEISLCAVDSTDPREWWTNSMLCYLAAISRYQADALPGYHERRVLRLFVHHPYTFKDPLFVKIITLHKLHGFDTYCLPMDEYLVIYNKFKGSNQFAKKIGPTFTKREFLCVGDGMREGNLKSMGFKSYWNIDTAFNLRSNEIDVEVRKSVPSGKDDIKWRTFTSVDDYECYRELFYTLVSSAKECDSDETLSVLLGQQRETFALKIGTDKPDEIRKMLEQYSKACEERSRVIHGSSVPQ